MGREDRGEVAATDHDGVGARVGGGCGGGVEPVDQLG
jgi:hypothetical protein